MKTRQDPSTKPYYRCLSCPRFRKLCGGRPTRDMDFQNWCEYMRDVKDVFHLTNAYIAKESEVSIKTIEKIMALNIEQDIMRATARRIELVVIGPVRDHLCDLDYDKNATLDIISKLQSEVEYWKRENDRKAKIIDKYLD
jgi:hypothetical protein